jgi:hypothetical protein
MSQCPKCASPNAWMERDRVDVTLRCLCGYNRVIASVLDNVMEDAEAARSTLKLPAKGSNLLKTLLALAVLHQADSSQVAVHMTEELGEPYKAKDVASYLYVLKGKGFVAQATDRKRMAGGSLWCVTDAAHGLLKQGE